MNVFENYKDFGANIGDFLQNVADKIRLCAYIIQHDKFVFANNKFAELIDLPLSEIATNAPEKLFNSIIHPDFRQQAKYFYSANLEERDLKPDIELKIINNSGREYWVNLDIQTIRGEAATLIFGMIIDITGRKQAEESLEISQDRYRNIFEHSKDAIFIADLNFGLNDFNKAAEGLTGYTKVELHQMKVSDLCHPDNSQDCEDIFDQLKISETVIKDTYIKRKDGAKVPVEISNKRIIIRGMPFVHVVARDITDRKQTEQALRDSEMFNRAVIENSPMGVSVRNRTGKLLSCNRSWQKIWNKSDADVYQDKSRERTGLKFDKNDEYLGQWQSKIRDIYEKGGQLHIPEIKTIGHHQREEHWVSQYFYAIGNDHGKVDKVVILTEDITERKKAELALQESELFNRAVIERSPLGVSVRNKYGKLLNCNRAWQEIWNKSDEDVRKYIAKEKAALEFNKKDDYLKQWHTEIRQIYEQGGYLHIPEAKTLYHDTGKERWVAQFFYAIKNDNGTVEKVVILTEDITERKKAEQALRASEEKFREIADMAPEGIYEISSKGTLTYANRQAFQILGFIPAEIDKNFNVFDIFQDVELERVKRNFSDILAGKKIGPNEYLAKKSDGSSINLLIHSCPVYQENKAAGLRGVIMDITERKRIDDALRNSEARYRTILNAAPLYIYAVNLEGIITFIDGKLLAIDGLDSRDIVGKSIFDIYDTAETRILFDGVLKGKFTHLYNVYNNKTYESRLERQFGPDSEVIGLIGISMDITEIKKAKEALQDTETKFRLLFENAGQPIFSMSRDGVFLTLNSTAAAYLGGQPEDFIGNSMKDLFPKKIAEYQIEKVQQAIDSGKKIIDENKTIVNGQIIWYIISIQPIVDSDGRINSALLIANDITQRKRLETRDKAKAELLDDLRHTIKLTECLQLGCQAILNTQLYKRAVIILLNTDGDITQYNHAGFSKPGTIDIISAWQSGRISFQTNIQNGLKLSHSYFLTCKNNVSKANTDKLDNLEYAAPHSEQSWQAYDQFFIPLMGEKNKPEGWLIVDSPVDGKWPTKGEAVFLEEIADIIVKTVHKIQSFETLQEERLVLQEKNITLREVLAHIEEEKMEIKNQVAGEIENSLLPVMKKLVKKDGTVNKTCYNILEHGLQALASSAGTRHIFSRLSPREIEICNIIKTGISSKELAKMLHISLATVQKHRESIRRKLGITNKNVNLMTYLKG